MKLSRVWQLLFLNLVLLVSFHLFAHYLKTVDGWGGVVSILEELVKATTVSLVLGGTIELINRKYHEESVDEIKKAVLTATLRRSLPDPIFREIDESVLKADIYRKNYKVFYKIFSEERCGANEYTLITEVTYTLVNLTLKQVSSPIKAAIEINQERTNDCGIEFFEISGLVVGEINQYTKTEDFLTKFEYPFELKGGSSVNVRIKYKQIQSQSFETITLTIPTTDATIEVLVPSGDLKVHAVSLHPDDIVAEHRDDEQHLFKWRLPGACLPGQGAILFWKKGGGVAVKQEPVECPLGSVCSFASTDNFAGASKAVDAAVAEVVSQVTQESGLGSEANR